MHLEECWLVLQLSQEEQPKQAEIDHKGVCIEYSPTKQLTSTTKPFMLYTTQIADSITLGRYSLQFDFGATQLSKFNFFGSVVEISRGL